MSKTDFICVLFCLQVFQLMCVWGIVIDFFLIVIQMIFIQIVWIVCHSRWMCVYVCGHSVQDEWIIQDECVSMCVVVIQSGCVVTDVCGCCGLWMCLDEKHVCGDWISLST